MATLSDVLKQAQSLSPHDRAELIRALGGPATRGSDLPLASSAAVAMNRPDVRDPIGWRKAEAGHAVLAIETPERDEEIPAGSRAIAGMWVNRPDLVDTSASTG